VYRIRKSRPKSAKSKDCGGSLKSAILPNTIVLGHVIDIVEPENQKLGQGVWIIFHERTYAIYP